MNSLSDFLSLDATLPNPSSLRFLPSQLAAASVYLARDTAGVNPWSPTLLKESLYCEEAIAPVAEQMYLEQVRKTPQAVKNKYHDYVDCVNFEGDTI
jgi:Cyclin, C-terminal domain